MAVAVTTSCVDDDKLQYSFEKPASIAGYEYLADYDALNTYVDRNAAPNFKLGAALAANDYNANGLVTRLANSNFDEIVAGNAMKMGSIVNENGEMDFSLVDAFVTNATENGLSVYGHTLAWHAQQPKKWLEKLIKDRELDIDPDEKTWKDDYVIDYTQYSSFPFYNMGYAPDFSPEEGLISLSSDGWYQYFAADQMGLAEGQKYKITVTYKSPVDATVKCILRWNWGDDGAMEGNLSLTATDEWKEAELEFSQELGASGGFVVFQLSGLANQRICFKNLKASHGETPAVEVLVDDYEYSYKDDTKFPWYVMGYEPQIVDGCLHSENPGSWYQYFIADHIPHPIEGDYIATIRVRGSVESDLTLNMGWGWGSGESASGRLHVSPEWTEQQVRYNNIPAKDCNLVLQPGGYDGTIDIAWVKCGHVVKMNTIPLTPEEKKDTLSWAMEEWIKGMMAACDGRVKGWDVVNEAISGGDADGDGIYDLQHGSADNENDFFWQDYLGDLDYVRTAVSLARQYGPEDIKLFVNDYNLESDWDDNQKLKSLIEWIKRWESDGVTKIDGIGSQMHISCSLNPNTLASRKAHITKMFELMAASGKLVRVSELDMGIDDENGKAIATSTIEALEKDPATFEQAEAIHKAMAEHYQFIVSEYLRIIPAAQQWGICQWCLTDSPQDSGWRADTPTGLWDLNYNRKHTYAGFANGLAK